MMSFEARRKTAPARFVHGNVLFEPVSAAALALYMLFKLIGFMIGFFGSIMIMEAIFVDDLGDVSVEIDDVEERVNYVEKYPKIYTVQRENLSRALTFNITYQWNNDIPKSFQPKISDIVIKGINNKMLEHLPRSTSISLGQTVTFSSEVELDPKISQIWEIHWTDMIAKGKVIVLTEDDKEEEIPFSFVLNTRPIGKPIL